MKCFSDTHSFSCRALVHDSGLIAMPRIGFVGRSFRTRSLTALSKSNYYWCTSCPQTVSGFCLGKTYIALALLFIDYSFNISNKRLLLRPFLFHFSKCVREAVLKLSKLSSFTHHPQEQRTCFASTSRHRLLHGYCVRQPLVSSQYAS